MRPTSTKAAAALAAAFVLTTVGAVTVTTGAVAQSAQLAYATAPRNDYVVFLDKNGTLPPSALRTVRLAASAAGPSDIVRLSGSPERTAAVKAALVREGVRPGMIEVRRGAGDLLPDAGLASDPVARRVGIQF